jgi:PAS domain S-box-containing protein
MTWQTILYFTSILITCGLTGFLAWYAWRQPALPGVRTYAVLALCECLMALTEFLSMVSGTQAQALFWFNLRFIFTALIPVLFLAFALAYGGHQNWLSKKLLAGALVIPVITQVMLWSNSLHGLWVKHEIGFHQNGSLWIADTGLRLPGLWFMVHSFYSLILLLAGIVVILLTAWRMRRQHRGQALLLAGGALVALGTSLVPVFNLLPHAGFNPFIPGIGISAILYALAIFRFQFLKKMPGVEEGASAKQPEDPGKRSLAVFIFIFFLFASAIAAIGYVSYQNYKSQFRLQMENQLTAIANLKVNGLQLWRSERLGDGTLLGNNAVFAGLVKSYYENPQDAQPRAEIQAWLENYLHVYNQYDQVRLLDTQGDTRLSAPAGLPSLSPAVIQFIPTVLQSGKVTLEDFYREEADQRVYLTVLVPILDPAAGDRIIGLISLRIDPTFYLYPNINQWPTSSTTAETLLVQREGDAVFYLNELRFEQNAALNLRFPLADTQVLAVKAVLGQTGVVQGVDYRGVAVVGAVGPVPGSPWFLVARMDISEVYAPLTARLWQTVLFFGVLILAAATGLALVWRQQRVRYYRAQAETAAALRDSEIRYRRLFEAARDGILILDAETGVVMDVNPFLIEMLGFPQEEIYGKELWELGFFKDIAANKANFLELQQKEYIRYEGLPMETADGRSIQVEIVSHVYQVDHHKVIQCNIRDITERIAAEQKLAEYSSQLEEMVEARTRQLRETQEKLIRQERLATLGQVAGSIGHELRNPLGVISNAIYFLKMAQPDAGATIKEYLDIIENETRASDKFITELLDFTRIKAVEREPVPVSELVRQTLERYPAPPSVEVTLAIPPDLPPVYADPHHVVQVLGNLTVNACQSMDKGGKLTISALAQGDMIRIAVQDTGVGIPPENMSKIFEPLFTTKIKGIGLGLTVSQKLAEANGGRIEVQSQPGKGSTFTLYLPVYKESV